MTSILAKNNAVIQSLLQRADQLTNSSFGNNASVVILGQDQYTLTDTTETNSTLFPSASEQNGLRIEEVDGVTADRLFQSLPPPRLYRQQQSMNAESTTGFAADQFTSTSTSAASYTSELYQDPNGPEIIHRGPLQGPVTYRQNISVRFLQPPPIPPPGPLIIKEVRPPQPPPLPPLFIRQCAPHPATPPPLILRERPPPIPPPIPAQTIIRRLPPTPPPPRSIIIERYAPPPPRPRDVIIERWLPYPKQTQQRRVIIYRAPPSYLYPSPRNTIILHEPARANIVRQVHRLGIQPHDPLEYVHRYGPTLLDTTTLITRVHQIGVTDDLGPLPSSFRQPYQLADNAGYYADYVQPARQPEYEYSTSTLPSSNQSETYRTNPQEDIQSILQRLGVPLY